MSDRPILFSAPMIRALLAGRKTRTRRLLTERRSVCGSGRWEDLDWSLPQVDRRRPRESLPLDGSGSYHHSIRVDGDPAGVPFGEYLHVPTSTGDGCVHRVYSRIEVGDVLWVREAWANLMDNDPRTGQPCEVGMDRIDPNGWSQRIAYAATDHFEWLDGDGFADLRKDGSPRSHWRPSIFMQRWASRLSLRVTAVRVERLQSITPDEVRAEAIMDHPVAFAAMAKFEGWTADAAGLPSDAGLIAGWAAGWDAINPSTPWASNPWVWAYHFEVV